MVLDDAIVAKGPFPSAVMLGYATVVVRGDSNAVALSAFLANSHTSAFDMSMTVLPLTEISLRP